MSWHKLRGPLEKFIVSLSEAQQEEAELPTEQEICFLLFFARILDMPFKGH